MISSLDRKWTFIYTRQLTNWLIENKLTLSVDVQAYFLINGFYCLNRFNFTLKASVATMSLHKLFTFTANILGLNFFEEVAPFTLVLLVNIAADVFTVVMTYKGVLLSNPHFKVVFICVDFVQLILPLLIKDFAIIQAMRSANFDRTLSRRMASQIDPLITRSNQKFFLINFVITFLMFFTKVIIAYKFPGFTMYTLAHLFTNQFNSATDFYFVYQIMRLRDHLQCLRNKFCVNIKSEILEVLELHRVILSRYSTYLTFVISMYFLLIIISLYWIFLRIIYNNLTHIRGNLYNELSINWKALNLWILDYVCFFYFLRPMISLLAIFLSQKCMKDKVWRNILILELKFKSFLHAQYTAMAVFISRESRIDKKETLLRLLLRQKSNFTVGKVISLELVTLCCVSSLLAEKGYLVFIKDCCFQMAAEVANYFIISIQLFIDNPFE